MNIKATTTAYVTGYLTVVGLNQFTTDTRLLILPLGVLGTYGVANLLTTWLNNADDA